MDTSLPTILLTAPLELTRVIGRGGMSVVYEGRLVGVQGFDKKVAVKMMLEKTAGDPRFLKLLTEEAKLVADLVHENIVQTYHLGQMDAGIPYIVMEYADGISLHDFMTEHERRGTKIPEALAVHIASRIARGLAYAHAFKNETGTPLGIVHRDVCPKNIIITTIGLAKLTDFGIAKARGNAVIGDNWLTGKVKYMSPEQAMRLSVDSRSDIYSLGAVLFEMLAGVPVRPLDARPLDPGFALIPIPWEDLPATTGAGLIDVLRRMLDTNPDRRFQDTNEMARALEYYIYKDGYGPTIQTVEAYLRTTFASLYEREHTAGSVAGSPTVAEP